MIHDVVMRLLNVEHHDSHPPRLLIRKTPRRIPPGSHPLLRLHRLLLVDIVGIIGVVGDVVGIGRPAEQRGPPVVIVIVGRDGGGGGGGGGGGLRGWFAAVVVGGGGGGADLEREDDAGGGCHCRLLVGVVSSFGDVVSCVSCLSGLWFAFFERERFRSIYGREREKETGKRIRVRRGGDVAGY
ncbi:hypothetical protein Droror1_Dr00023801 [Drosera rotundifolia]